MEQTYSFKVKSSDEDVAKARKAGKELKEETKDLKLEKLAAGDTIVLDGKRTKVKSVVLNADSGKYDVETELVADEAAGRPTAEGNDPHPERHAVKDVVFDPRFSPKIVDAVAASTKVLDQQADADARRKEADEKDHGKDAEKKAVGAGERLKGHSPSPAGQFEKAAIESGAGR
jgi:hypothetical protein